MGTDVSWLIGGPQGSGVESAANIFSRVCASVGYSVYGKREFYSNIKGEHSYFAVRVADRIIRSNVSGVTVMVSYDAETIFRHAIDVAQGGAVLYDSALDDVSTGDVRTLDGPFRARLEGRLSSSGRPCTVPGALAEAAAAGASVVPVQFGALLERLAEEADNPRLKGMKRMFNVLGVSLSLGLMRAPRGPLEDAIGAIFAKKPQVAELNKLAARIAYGRGEEIDSPCGPLAGAEKATRTMLVQGHQGTAIGKMVCGCRMQPYYPITPASDESVYLESNQILSVRGHRPGSSLVVQTEDEICAIGMAIGGALAGARSATCTSGPGFSLMAEMLGWAGINEVPLVVTLYQRSGPSTGLPTRHGQDDLLFAVHAGHGEFPRMVYASGDVEESFYDTGRCFNYAEKYQLPVIHMMDKLIASSVTTCPRFDPSRVSVRRGKLLREVPPTEEGYRRFARAEDGVSPRSVLGLENGIFWNTGDESDERGHITEDPVVRAEMMDKRLMKEGRILEEVPKEEQVASYGVRGHTVVCWGSAKGPALDAISMLKEEDGVDMGLVQVKLLWPFPAALLGSLLEDASVIIDVEANQTGQLGALMRQGLGRDPDHYISKYTGRAITCTELLGALRRIVSGKAGKREVLVHGA